MKLMSKTQSHHKRLREEIISKIEPLRAKGVKFIIPLPEPEAV
jgi:hypothetical protein